ncbi:lytic transglycosylase domain-containing protein [Marilutibacter alkalisoli]|uniref:Lytic transglycosylase domain-containing protein n=1 Tax=Marilutibacter alkalisoli TaxID=2591633 RepID=A0A514BVE9_9GAMM|nr:lytic transglycosylase domain-containing protein [Lysobacter alkalisoli]
MEMMACVDLAVPVEVMRHVVKVESSFNPYAIGVVGGRLVRQPQNLAEAVATARMLEEKGYNFSLGLAQVNRYNLTRYGLTSYERAFQTCPNLQAGARILAECHGRADGDWGKAFSCYYSGNFTTGFRHGYVQKVYASMRNAADVGGQAIPLAGTQGNASAPRPARATAAVADSLLARRIESESVTAPASLIAPVAATEVAPVAAAPASMARAQTPASPQSQAALLPQQAAESSPEPVMVRLMGAPAAGTATSGHGMAAQPVPPSSPPSPARDVASTNTGKDEAFVF